MSDTPLSTVQTGGTDRNNIVIIMGNVAYTNPSTCSVSTVLIFPTCVSGLPLVSGAWFSGIVTAPALTGASFSAVFKR